MFRENFEHIFENDFFLFINYSLHVRNFSKKKHTRSSFNRTRYFCIFYCFNNFCFIDLRLFRFRSIFFYRFSKSFHLFF